MNDKQRSALNEMLPELIRLRRDFHAHPELGFAEHRTGQIIADYLDALGFEVRAQVAGTGVVGLWRGSDTTDTARTVGFRADMDGLAVQEMNTFSYRSVHKRVMHACGHDGHMAILLGLARWLAERPDRPAGNVKLIFQPGEELCGGAVKMIEAGVLEDPAVEQIFGLHLWPTLEAGIAAVVSGPLMASVDGYTIRIQGRGAHVAMPHEGVDAVLVAAQITVSLQQVVARYVDPRISAVVSVGKIEAEGADNALAETASLRGLARTFDPETRSRLPKLIHRCAKGVAESMGAQVTFEWSPLFPPTISDDQCAHLVAQAATEVLGSEEKVVQERTMASEDMSLYLEKVPGCYFFLGSANASKGLDKSLHNPQYDFDEAVLPLGVAILAECAERFFQGQPHPGRMAT